MRRRWLIRRRWPPFLRLKPCREGVVEPLFGAAAADEADVAGIGHDHLRVFGLADEGEGGGGGHEEVVLRDADP